MFWKRRALMRKNSLTCANCWKGASDRAMTAAMDLNAIAQTSAVQIVDCLVEGTLIAIFAGLVLKVTRRQNLDARFAVWFSALMAIAILPFLGALCSRGVGTDCGLVFARGRPRSVASPHSPQKLPAGRSGGVRSSTAANVRTQPTDKVGGPVHVQSGPCSDCHRFYETRDHRPGLGDAGTFSGRTEPDRAARTRPPPSLGRLDEPGPEGSEGALLLSSGGVVDREESVPRTRDGLRRCRDHRDCKPASVRGMPGAFGRKNVASAQRSPRTSGPGANSSDLAASGSDSGREPVPGRGTRAEARGIAGRRIRRSLRPMHFKSAQADCVR